MGIKQGAQPLLLHLGLCEFIIFFNLPYYYFFPFGIKKCMWDVAGITGLHLFILAGEYGDAASSGSLKVAL